MTDGERGVAAAFDARAATYAQSEWHRRAAERLVALCRLQRGMRVLDAATGTGFAALAAAKAVEAAGHVVGVDLSAGMLREAAAAARSFALANVELVHGTVTTLPQFGDAAFDAVTCASGLLYMAPDAALAEWRRVLRPGGILAFSEMAAGSPPAARIFRDLAAEYGLSLTDPCAARGTAGACRAALESAGFDVVAITTEPVTFSTRDLEQAWDANFRSPGHAPVQQLPDAERSAFRARYLTLLERETADRLAESQVLYAIGRKPRT